MEFGISSTSEEMAEDWYFFRTEERRKFPWFFPPAEETANPDVLKEMMNGVMKFKFELKVQ